MPLIQKTLSASTVAVIPLDAPTGRVTVTILSAPATTFATADGSTPVIPTDGVEVSSAQRAIAGATGQQEVLVPPMFGDHMAIPTVRLLSAGTPVMSVEW